MKKVFFILVASLLAVNLPAETSAFKLLMHTERLWRAEQWQEAMDSATRVLVIAPNNSAAKNFVHDHWDDMLRRTATTLEKNADEANLNQSLVRLEIYRLMAEIADNLREVQMPIVGTDWQWYPELYYNQGDYDSERMHVYRMLMDKANDCLLSYDTDGAREAFLTALRYLIPGSEREGNRADIQASLIRKMIQLSSTSRIPEAIYAYELTNLSDALCSDTVHLDTVAAMRPRLQQHVADLYHAQADELQAAGDSAKAADYRALALDWETVVEPDPDR
jgi:hypothetical protein